MSPNFAGAPPALLWRQLHWPRPLELDRVVAMLRAWAADQRSSHAAEVGVAAPHGPERDVSVTPAPTLCSLTVAWIAVAIVVSYGFRHGGSTPFRVSELLI